MKRRHFLRSAVVVGAIPICGVTDSAPSPTGFQLGKTPALTPAEQETIASALGKKGTYNEAQATYSIPLPRGDLKVTVKGEPVPIPFGFGGWVAFKKTLDGKHTVPMASRYWILTKANPSCAFTPFATCPLPPKQNRLTTRILAGEKNYGNH